MPVPIHETLAGKRKGNSVMAVARRMLNRVTPRWSRTRQHKRRHSLITGKLTPAISAPR
jgi:hypothetical protein